MTTADIHEMLDLPQDGHPRAPAAKRQKTVLQRPEGVSRELFALLGERAPPVAITEQAKYKGRPKWTHKTRPWVMEPFRNQARTDELVLRHWRRKNEPKDTQADAMEVDEKPAVENAPYHFAKYNVKVEIPSYTDDTYALHLRKDGWSKAETDYLFELCNEYDLRWVVIIDRYNFKPPADEAAVESKPARTMEDLKARYYSVVRLLTEMKTPQSNMTQSEMNMFNSLNFDHTKETKRKAMVATLLNRSPDELKEEEILLAELRRIINTQDKLLEERRELYLRLEAPPSNGGNSQMFFGSAGLSGLLQSLANNDKNKKRRSILGPGGIDTQSPGSAVPGGSVPNSAREGRDSLGSAGLSNKKGATVPSIAERKKLSPLEERVYGIQHHDRLTSGTYFRHDKVTKLVQAKSNIQAQRVSAALAELDIPHRLVMPTSAVCSEYERLIQNIHVLLDVRKVSEKLEGELKVAVAAREGDKEEEEEGEVEGVVEEEEEEEVEEEEEGDDGEDAEEIEEVDDEDEVKVEDDDGDKKSQSQSHKRSASVFSAASEQSTKRQRK